MKKRGFELMVVVALVAFAVAATRMNRVETPSVSPTPLGTPVASATTIPMGAATPLAAQAPAPGQTDEATTLWSSLYQEAQAKLAQGDNRNAETTLLAALKLAPMAGPDALHETLDDLGLVCYRLGEYQRAADYQTRAIAAVKSHPATAGLYETRLALALDGLQKREDALAALGRAQDSFKQAYPAGSPAYSDAMNSLAAQYRAMGDNSTAAELTEGIE